MRRYSHAESVDSPDMTPMLDIVFIMLIFFIVSTSFVQEEAVDWLSLSSEKTNKPDENKEKPLLITIDETGAILMQSSLVSPEALRARVQAARSQFDFKMAVIRVDSSVSTSILVKAVDDIKLAGISNVTVGKL